MTLANCGEHRHTKKQRIPKAPGFKRIFAIIAAFAVFLYLQFELVQPFIDQLGNEITWVLPMYGKVENIVFDAFFHIDYRPLRIREQMMVGTIGAVDGKKKRVIPKINQKIPINIQLNQANQSHINAWLTP